MAKPTWIPTKCCETCKHSRRGYDRDGAYMTCKKFRSRFVNPIWLCTSYKEDEKEIIELKAMQMDW